jgi:Uma2 family endonuclease
MLAPFLREEGFSVLMSIMRVYVPSERFFAYPDVLILHEKPKLWGDTDDCLLNPASIIEVTTSRTERYDREGKFRSYRGMDSLIEYVTIDSESRFVERWYKTDTWYLDPTKHVDSLKLWDCTLALDQIYEDVVFSVESSSSAT